MPARSAQIFQHGAAASRTPGAAKRKAAAPLAAQAVRGVKKYQPLLFAGFLGPRNLVVVERPWLAIMATFPPALYRSRYGM